MKTFFFLIFLIFILGCSEELTGGKIDEHGCLMEEGSQWCEANNQCQKFWEEPCPVITLESAKEIALASSCVEEGGLLEEAFYNDNTKTWWIEMNLIKEGCSPACVVDAESLTAEVNWRCIGSVIGNFEECVSAGNPVMESYPQQCEADGRVFVEDIKISII